MGKRLSEDTYQLMQRISIKQTGQLDAAHDAVVGLFKYADQSKMDDTGYVAKAAYTATNRGYVRIADRLTKLDPEHLDRLATVDPTSQYNDRFTPYSGEVIAAFRRLPSILKEAAWLRFSEGLSERAISARLGTSQAAAAKRIRRAKAHLRQDLESYAWDTYGIRPGRNQFHSFQ